MSFRMEILNRTYSATEVSYLSGANPKDIQNWIQRGVIVGHKIEGGGGKGIRRRFSFYNIMEIAIARAILDSGSRNAEAAFEAASGFSHIAHGGSGWVGIPHTGPYRLPAFPFHHKWGMTRLFVHGGNAYTVLQDLPQPTKEHSVSRAMRLLGDPKSYLVVQITELFWEICGKLELDFRDVLDEAYSEAVE